jgi:hypothetical protein
VAFENLLEPERIQEKVTYKKVKCTGGWWAVEANDVRSCLKRNEVEEALEVYMLLS